MAQYVFSMNHLTKTVPPKRQILKDISLSFFPGAKIGVLGLNGSGKSSLLKIMAGVDKEFEGEAIPMAGLSIGYLPQEPQLNPEHTVREAVEEAMAEVNNAKARLEEVYAAYAEEDADFDALAAEQGELEAIIAAAGTDSEHQLEIAADALRLPFAATVVYGSDDPYCAPAQSQALAAGWGAEVLALPGAGHVNADSGLGDWPAGLALLAALARRANLALPVPAA